MWPTDVDHENYTAPCYWGDYASNDRKIHFTRLIYQWSFSLFYNVLCNCMYKITGPLPLSSFRCEIVQKIWVQPEFTAKRKHSEPFSLFHHYLTLLDSKLITRCQQYRARPACKSVQSDMILYKWLTKFKFKSWYP